jgi:tellurite methyltransferase
MTPKPWRRYYDAAGEDPRDTLLFALARFEADPLAGSERVAVDFGCGTGRDTAELLRRGWTVLAVDGEAEAIARLRTKLGDAERLTTQVQRFEAFSFPPADLVNSSFALPFCPPGVFPSVWDRMAEALVDGGRFAGHLFGERDDWALTGGSPTKGEITFQTRSEVEELVRPFEAELFDEVELDRASASGEDKHWHVFNLVLRK